MAPRKRMGIEKRASVWTNALSRASAPNRLPAVASCSPVGCNAIVTSSAMLPAINASPPFRESVMRHNVPMAVKRNRAKRAPMSRNRSGGDPRVLRTRTALGNALVQLMTERAFESITVQDVLDRAGVGRSNFYVHYDGKDDLLTSDVDRFFGSVADAIGGNSKRVLPVRE